MASKQDYKLLSIKLKLKIVERIAHLRPGKKKEIAVEYGIPISILKTKKKHHVLGSSRLKEKLMGMLPCFSGLLQLEPSLSLSLEKS